MSWADKTALRRSTGYSGIQPSAWQSMRRPAHTTPVDPNPFQKKSSHLHPVCPWEQKATWESSPARRPQGKYGEVLHHRAFVWFLVFKEGVKLCQTDKTQHQNSQEIITKQQEHLQMLALFHWHEEKQLKGLGPSESLWVCQKVASWPECIKTCFQSRVGQAQIHRRETVLCVSYLAAVSKESSKQKI